MPKRLYESPAEKQKAYRERMRVRHVHPPPEIRTFVSPLPPKPKPRNPSRPARLLHIEAELRKLASEYQEWRDATPENLAEGQLAQELEEAIGQLEAIADDVADIEPPRIGR